MMKSTIDTQLSAEWLVHCVQDSDYSVHCSVPQINVDAEIEIQDQTAE